jgi:hypothetical protein
MMVSITVQGVDSQPETERARQWNKVRGMRGWSPDPIVLKVVVRFRVVLFHDSEICALPLVERCPYRRWACNSHCGHYRSLAPSVAYLLLAIMLAGTMVERRTAGRTTQQ